jgi:hypothetical protein
MVMRHVLFILRDDNELEMPENMVLRKLFRTTDINKGGGGVT